MTEGSRFFIVKITIHSSCEIEDNVENLIFNLSVIPDRVYYGLCVLINDIGRRFLLQLQRSYQGQDGDVSQFVRGN